MGPFLPTCDAPSALLDEYTHTVTSDSAHSIPAWFAIKVRTRSEPVAAMALKNRGLETFCPSYTERRRYSDRVKLVQSVFFPGYLFCRLELRCKVSVLSSDAVEYVVGAGGTPIPIPDSEIERISLAVTAGARRTPYFPSGQRVRVEYGALKGLEGVLQRRKSSLHLIVSVHLLQRSVSLHIPEDQVCFL